jgi:putative DNA primase/helicase
MIDSCPVGDADYTDARVWLSRADTFDVSFPPSDVAAAFDYVARQKTVHPVRDYLDGLRWDGQRRLDTLCARYFGNTGELESLMTRKWLVSGAARVRSPGCKVDTVLVLQSGKQGLYKSTFFSEMGGEWFTDSLDKGDGLNKDALLTAHRYWICELAELDGVTRKSDTEHLKAILSSRADDIRKPYAMKSTKLPRGFVFGGTVNSDDFLRDETGSRRFWIVAVKKRIDCELVRAERDQVWAEADAAYLAGEPWWFDSETDERIEREQRAYTVSDSREEKIADWLRGPGASGRLTTRRVLVECLGYEDRSIDKKAEMAVATTLRRLGYDRRRQRTDGGALVYAFERPEAVPTSESGNTGENTIRRSRNAVVPTVPTVPAYNETVSPEHQGSHGTTTLQGLQTQVGTDGQDAESRSENAEKRVPASLPDEVGTDAHPSPVAGNEPPDNDDAPGMWLIVDGKLVPDPIAPPRSVRRAR